MPSGATGTGQSNFLSLWYTGPSLCHRSGAEFAPDDLCASTQGMQLAPGHVAGQGGHAAVGRGVEFVGIHELQRFAQGVGDLFGRFDGIGCHVDGAYHDFLAADELDQVHRDVRVLAFQGDDVNAGFLQLGERFLVLQPFRTQGFFPVGVGLDAVTVADVYGGFAFQPFDGPFQGGDTPIIHFFKEDIECRFVELDDVHTSGFQFPGFLVEDLGEFPGQFFAALVVAVVQRVDHRHGTRQCPFDGLLGLLAQEFCVFDKNGFLPRYRANDCRYARVITVADADSFTLFEIDAAEVFDECRDEVLACLFAVADDIYARLQLLLQGDAQGVLLAFDQFFTLQLPRRPEGLRLCQPGGFGQASCGGSG